MLTLKWLGGATSGDEGKPKGWWWPWLAWQGQLLKAGRLKKMSFPKVQGMYIVEIGVDAMQGRNPVEMGEIP